MVTFLLLTLVFLLLVGGLMGLGKRKEIMENWHQYYRNPFFMATAFLYKPEDDPRSRFEFMNDNFTRVMQSIIIDALKGVLAPIFDIFQVTGGGVVGSMGGVRAIQTIMATMMNSFHKIFSIFENRFKSTMYQFALTFRKLQTAMAKLWGVVAASVYESIAVIASILSSIDLIIKVVIIILVILVAIVFLLFLFFWPVIPLILVVIGVITTAGMGAAVGGMAETFCFDPATPVVMRDGTRKPISEIRLGEELGEGCGTVTARMEFQQMCADLYTLRGIRVTGSHLIWWNGEAIPVREHPEAVLVPGCKERTLYCLNTETHRIPVQTEVPTLTYQFADWEELDEESLEEWNRKVHGVLNPGVEWVQTKAVVKGEAALQGSVRVQRPQQPPIEIRSLRPGMMVMGEGGEPTRVLGIVELAASEVYVDEGAEGLSDAVWRRESPSSPWQQGSTQGAIQDKEGEEICRESWFSLITEAGTVLLESGIAIRDFTDLGIHALPTTYEWVLATLGKTEL